MNHIIKEIAQELAQADETKAVVLGGSSVSDYRDEISDYDLYVYSNKPAKISERTKIASKYADKYEINNTFFEPGDEWILRDSGKVIDIMFRNTDWPAKQIEHVWINGSASTGYSTAFIYNIKNSEILYDPSGFYKDLQQKVNTPYPQKLAENIITLNFSVMSGKIAASFREQIVKAVKRNDYVNINNRITAYLNSYFDILFAVNRVLHPGEKRLVRYAKDNCKNLPDGFETGINSLITALPQEKIQFLENLTKNLEKITY